MTGYDISGYGPWNADGSHVDDDAPTGAYGIQAVPPHTPGALTCGTCGRAWMEDITPAGRCPWEDVHGGWVPIVHLDGVDEGRAIVDALYNVDGVVAHGPTAESIAETVAYLSQWDYGDDDDTYPYEPWGSRDSVWHDVDGYTLSANLGLGYVSLYRRAGGMPS